MEESYVPYDLADKATTMCAYLLRVLHCVGVACVIHELYALRHPTQQPREYLMCRDFAQTNHKHLNSSLVYHGSSTNDGDTPADKAATPVCVPTYYFTFCWRSLRSLWAIRTASSYTSSSRLRCQLPNLNTKSSLTEEKYESW